MSPPPNSAFERRRQRTVNQRIELFRNEFKDQQQGGPGQDQQQGGPGQDQQQGGPGQDQQQGGPGQEYDKLQSPHENEILI